MWTEQLDLLDSKYDGPPLPWGLSGSSEIGSTPSSGTRSQPSPSTISGDPPDHGQLELCAWADDLRMGCLTVPCIFSRSSLGDWGEYTFTASSARDILKFLARQFGERGITDLDVLASNLTIETWVRTTTSPNT